MTRRELTALGDSHVDVFERIRERQLLPNYEISVCSVPGATAQGIVNPKSRTDALRLFEERLRRTSNASLLVFLLGEVDCGFLIWWRAQELGVPVEAQLERSLTNYLRFLAGVRRSFDVLVLSAPLPTIRDGDVGPVVDLRQAVRASQRQRTDLTLEYNRRLASGCRALRIAFLDLSDDEFDAQTGCVREALRSADPRDHHHNPDAYAELVVRRLRCVQRSFAPGGHVGADPETMVVEMVDGEPAG